mgnify:CR=1 FL=1
MATSVTTETVNGDLCELPPDLGKSPGPWKRSKEDGNQPLSFRDVRSHAGTAQGLILS